MHEALSSQDWDAGTMPVPAFPSTVRDLVRCHIALEPVYITEREQSLLRDLGEHLALFYRAQNALYTESVAGRQPTWIAQYLELGKPERLIARGRACAERGAIPGIIRPDIIPGADGYSICELDSVPGGFGMIAALAQCYESAEYSLIGDVAIPEGFAAMLCAHARTARPSIAVIVSNEAADYRAEMRWLTDAMGRGGVDAYCVRPDELSVTLDGVAINTGAVHRKVDVAYRFFELFDLHNIENADELMAAADDGAVAMTPPANPQLEEKMWFALLQNPLLTTWWISRLGASTFEVLCSLLPPTWVLDPVRQAHVNMPALNAGGRPIASWADLSAMTKRERRLVIKPSGFSERAWGSRGVVVGHDKSSAHWSLAVESALDGFQAGPSILQEFRDGRHFHVRYEADGAIKTLEGRARLTPYYFASGNTVTLSHVMAIICPLDKKKIHGMRDAVVAPCAVSSSRKDHASTSVDQ